MASETADMQALMGRLERLERQNRWLKGAGVLVLASVGALVLMAQAAPQNRTVQAGRFILTDSEGGRAAVLSLDGGGPGLVMSGPHGRAAFAVTNDGSALSLFDAKGRAAALLAINENGPTLGLRYGDKKGGALLSLGSDGPLFTLDDRQGTPRASVTLDADGPLLTLRDQQGNVRIRLTVGEDGPSLSVSDKEGFRTTLGAASLKTPTTGGALQTSAASLVMSGKDGNVIWRAP